MQAIIYKGPILFPFISPGSSINSVYKLRCAFKSAWIFPARKTGVKKRKEGRKETQFILISLKRTRAWTLTFMWYVNMYLEASQKSQSDYVVCESLSEEPELGWHRVKVLLGIHPSNYFKHQFDVKMFYGCQCQRLQLRKMLRSLAFQRKSYNVSRCNSLMEPSP